MSNEINSFIEYLDKSMNMSMQIPETLTELLATLLKERNRAGDAQKLQENELIAEGIRKKEFDAIEINSKNSNNLIRDLRKAGVEPVLDGQIQNKYFFYTEPKDRIAVMNVMRNYEGKYTMLQSTKAIDKLSQIETSQLVCLNEKEARTIQYNASRQGIFTDIKREDNHYLVRFNREHQNKMKHIYNNNIKSYVSMKEMTKLDPHFQSIKIKDETLAYMVVKRAEQNNIRINCVEKGIGENKAQIISFPSVNERVMQRILNDSCFDIAGVGGDIMRKQINYEMNNRLDMMQKVLNQELNTKDVVLDDNGHILKVNDKTYEYTNNNTGETSFILKDDKEKLANIINDKFDRVVILSGDEYKAYEELNHDERIEYFVNKETDCGKPELTQAEQDLLKKKETQREVVSEKLSQAHPSDEHDFLDDYIPEQTCVEFNARTDVNESLEQEEVDEIYEEIEDYNEEIEHIESNDELVEAESQVFISEKDAIERGEHVLKEYQQDKVVTNDIER